MATDIKEGTYKGFKIGDRVVAIKPPDGNSALVGKSGIILKFNPNDRLDVYVSFEGMSREYNYYCERETLELKEDLRKHILEPK